MMATYEALKAASDHSMRAAELDRVSRLAAVLRRLGNPDQQVKIIHIAGTNGKGSTGAFIAAGLQNAGYRVGHFASPVFGPDREQIKIADAAISATDYAGVMTAIMQKADLAPAAFTTFEWDVLVALAWFAQTACDWVVLEAGLGGQNDATNAIASPKAVVFTHIALDHTAILGKTLAAIAQVKAQIIKPQSMVFIAAHQAPAAWAVLTQVAQAHQAQAVRSTAAFALTPTAVDWTGTTAKLPDQTRVKVRMLGGYQLANAELALTVGAWLVEEGVIAALTPFVAALAEVQLPGRLQQLEAKPRLVIDAGHNPDALPQVLATIRQLQGISGRLLVVAGFLRDKAVRQLAAALAAADQVWVTTPNHPLRALPGAELQRLVPGSLAVADVQAGVLAAKAQATATDVILVVGSFYLIGDLL